MGKQARTNSRELRNARADAERNRKKRRQWFVGGGMVIIVGLVAAVVISLVNSAGKGNSPNAAGSPGAIVSPAAATATGALVVGTATAPVKLEVYLDYMCPYCGRFERANGGELERMVADGTVRLELHPMSFLDKTSSGTRYSTRAANAVATVADRAPARVLAFNTALFAQQPGEQSSGLSDDQVALLASNAGVPQDVVNLFPQRIFEPWIAASTTADFAAGITGTPTVKINGQQFKGDLYSVGPLTTAITTAKGKQ